MVRKTFVYDLDDTLLDNHHDYSRASLVFVEWMIDTLGRAAPDAQTILNLQVDIDHKAAEKYGFGRSRFPSSLVDTYRHICAARNLAPRPEDEAHAYAIGNSVFDEARYRSKGLLPGAERTLEFHKIQGDELILLTKGDLGIQESKIRALALERWFGDRMHIVLSKTAQDLARVTEGRERRFTWHVGNSVRSDVTPALSVGLGVVYCPCETWQFERQHDGVPTHSRLLTIDRLEQLIDHYGRLP